MEDTTTTLTAPALQIVLTGKATSNLKEFRAIISAGLAQINLTPQTPEEFGEAVQTVKQLGVLEKSVQEAKAKALADAEDINRILLGLDDCGEEMRQTRLKLEKVIEAKREEVKQAIIQEGVDSLICAKRLRIPTFGNAIKGAVKGKKNDDSMREAVRRQVAIHNGMIERNRKLIEDAAKCHGEELIPDSEDLEVKSTDTVEGEIRRRVEARKHAIEKEALAAKAREAEQAAKAAVASQKPKAADGLFSDAIAPEAPQKEAPKDEVDDLPDPEAPAPAVDEDMEWQWVRDQVMSAFAPLKMIMPNIKGEKNKAKFDKFRSAVGAAWKEVY